MLTRLLLTVVPFVVFILTLNVTDNIYKLKEHVKYQQETIQQLKSELEYKDLVLTNKCKK